MHDKLNRPFGPSLRLPYSAPAAQPPHHLTIPKNKRPSSSSRRPPPPTVCSWLLSPQFLTLLASSRATTAAATSDSRMTAKPTASPAPPQPAVDVIKSSGVAGMDSKKPPAPVRQPWTWTRVVRYVSLYYLINVIGIGVTIEGFRRLVAAGDTDIAARTRATGVVAAGNVLRGAAAAAAVTNLSDTRLGQNVVMIEFVLVTVAVALTSPWTRSVAPAPARRISVELLI